MVLNVFRVALVEYQNVGVHLFGHSHFLERLLDFVHFAFIEHENVLVALLCLAAFHTTIGSKASGRDLLDQDKFVVIVKSEPQEGGDIVANEISVFSVLLVSHLTNLDNQE